MPDVKKQLIEQGAIPVGNTPQQFAAIIAQDRKRYAKIIADNHLSAD
jgi:tripartite-type tricarboxylate transporter receptor subunit TctC